MSMVSTSQERNEDAIHSAKGDKNSIWFCASKSKKRIQARGESRLGLT
ncbi:MAG: hypothetical protein ACLQME_08745 [Alphaproteobacteria bacterium]